MNKSVFVSHAVKDVEIVREIVGLIEEGIGVPEVEIFCSSLEGYGIPNGENFVTYIRNQLLEPKVVVLVISPAYFESKFCLSELGAAWVKSHAIFPILVPPLQFSDVNDVLLGTEVMKIDDDIAYNQLLEKLRAEVAFAPKSQTKWDTKRRAFLKAIAPLLAKVDPPSSVSAAEYDRVTQARAKIQEELEASEVEIRRLRARVVAMERPLISRIETALYYLGQAQSQERWSDIKGLANQAITMISADFPEKARRIRESIETSYSEEILATEVRKELQLIYDSLNRACGSSE